MLTKLQKRKQTALFRRQDMNHDGFYGRADAQEFARRICEVLGLPPGSPEYALIHTRVGRRPDALRDFYKAKGDQYSLADYLELGDLIVHDDDLFNDVITEQVKAVMGLWDRDGDGRLSADEFVKLEWCYAVDEEAAREAFRHLDRDGDGYLTIEECKKAAEEFYRSSDPDAPGNWLFGPY